MCAGVCVYIYIYTHTHTHIHRARAYVVFAHMRAARKIHEEEPQMCSRETWQSDSDVILGDIPEKQLGSAHCKPRRCKRWCKRSAT